MEKNPTNEVDTHSSQFVEIYDNLVLGGEFSSPRGLKVLEVEDFSYDLQPYVRFANFEHRKLNLNYIKDEFQWYLKGNRFDTSITEKASMWKGIIDDDGGINSNYGQYIFGEQQQFLGAANQLLEDKDSRRASIVILTHEKLGAKDTPCTYAMNFRIRQNKLNMSVHMRAQDAIFGMGNDAPAFSFVHEMMYQYLKDTYKELEYGNYHHTADSFHVYERHFKMLSHLSHFAIKDVTGLDEKPEDISKYEMVYCPKINGKEEVEFLMKSDFSNIPSDFEFSSWLNNRD